MQTIRDGATGTLLAASELRPGEREPLIQLAQTRSLPGLLLPGATLFDWRNNRPGAAAAEDIPLLLHRSPMVHQWQGGALQSRSGTLEEVQRMCPSLGRVQTIVDEEASKIFGLFTGNGAAYGREIHQRVRDRIDHLDPPNPNLSAELTFLDGTEGRTNASRTSRLDIMEVHPGRPLLCIYDVKSGREGYSGNTMRRHAEARTSKEQDMFVATVEVRPNLRRW